MQLGRSILADDPAILGTSRLASSTILCVDFYLYFLFLLWAGAPSVVVLEQDKDFVALRMGISTLVFLIASGL